MRISLPYLPPIPPIFAYYCTTAHGREKREPPPVKGSPPPTPHSPQTHIAPKIARQPTPDACPRQGLRISPLQASLVCQCHALPRYSSNPIPVHLGSHAAIPIPPSPHAATQHSGQGKCPTPPPPQMPSPPLPHPSLLPHAASPPQLTTPVQALAVQAAAARAAAQIPSGEAHAAPAAHRTPARAVADRAVPCLAMRLRKP